MFYEVESDACNRFFFTNELRLSIELINGTDKFRVYLNSEQLRLATLAGISCVEIGQNAVAL